MSKQGLAFLALLVFGGICSKADAITILRGIPGIDRLPAQSASTVDASVTEDPILRIETGAHSARILSTATDARGTWLVTAAADKSVRVWEVASGRLLRVLRPPAGDGIVGDIYRAAISPNGATVAVGWQSANRAAIFLFDRASGIVNLRIDGLADVVTDLQYSPDGRLIAATVVRGGVQLFDAASGKELGRDFSYGLDSYSVDFSPEGRRLLTTSLDGLLRMYSTDGGLRKIGQAPATKLKSQPLNARFSPNGQWIAVGYDRAGGIEIFRAADLSNTGPLMDIFVWSNIPHFAWSRDGRFIDGIGSDSHGHMMIRRWSEHEAVRPGGPTFNTLSSHVDVSLPGAPIICNPTPLPGGGLIIANESPGWGVLARDGNVDWRQEMPRH
jgi:WD40 repeat protein